MMEYLQVAKSAASNAVAVLRDAYLDDAQAVRANDKDLKTKADMAAQDALLSILEPTKISIISEEASTGWTDGVLDRDHLLWIVDPLDGTVNFARGFPMAAVSVALWKRGRPLLGVIHEIYQGDVYCGVIPDGAWLNDQSIQVSPEMSVKNAILATGFPSGRSYTTDSLFQFVRQVQRYKKVRMLGSAALMIAHVACGHFDAYEEEDIYLWDVAAGLALVAAAGGRFDIEPGSDTMKYKVRAWNGNLLLDSGEKGLE